MEYSHFGCSLYPTEVVEINYKIQGRIYHHYKHWEDWEYGFYNNCSGNEKKKKIKSVLKMFQDKKLTRKYMMRVIDEWKYSCEHNFTNDLINQIAYLGQAACCIFDEVPNMVTMEAWHLLNIKHRNRADKIAAEIIKIWEERNKQIQICLNI